MPQRPGPACAACACSPCPPGPRPPPSAPPPPRRRRRAATGRLPPCASSSVPAEKAQAGRVVVHRPRQPAASVSCSSSSSSFGLARRPRRRCRPLPRWALPLRVLLTMSRHGPVIRALLVRVSERGGRVPEAAARRKYEYKWLASAGAACAAGPLLVALFPSSLSSSLSSSRGRLMLLPACWKPAKPRPRSSLSASSSETALADDGWNVQTWL